MVPPPLIRRLRFTLLLLILVATATVWRAGVVRSAAAQPPARHTTRRIPFSDVRPFGANFFLEHEVEAWKKEQTAQMAAQAGLGWAKQHFPWSDIEPSPGVYNWRKYDQLVDLYRDSGLQVIARLDWPPAWVEPAAWVDPADRGKINAPPADPALFGRFVTAVVRRYRDKVRFFQIWNEPNLVSEWGANPAHAVDPAEYQRLLAVASDMARQANPDAVILSAPLAINAELPTQNGNMGDLDYLACLYGAGGAEDFDILSFNAFGMDRPPADAPSAQVLNFRRAELQRAVMVEHGDANKAVWFNEYGWNAAPPSINSAWKQVSEAKQAAWTVDGVRWADAHWPWAGVFSVWYFRQWGDRSAEMADYYFRMVDVDFRPRQLYGAVQQASAEIAVAGPGVWAELAAPVRVTDLSAWRWHFADGADDGNAITAVAPSADLQLRFRGGGVIARVRAGVRGAVVSATVDEPDPDRSSKAELRLPHAEGEWQWATLAEGLSAGEHVLTLRDDGAARSGVTIDSFRVLEPLDEDRPDLWLTFLGTALVGLVGLAWVDARRVAARIQL